MKQYTVEEVKKIVEDYDTLNSLIEEHWLNSIAPNYGYFTSWGLEGNNITIYYDYPNICGGGPCDKPDEIPVSEFKCIKDENNS